MKFPLPDAEWRELVTSFLALAFPSAAPAGDGGGVAAHGLLTIVRQSTLFGTLNRLLAKTRAPGTVTIAWRPLWCLLQSSCLSPLTSRTSGSATIVQEHMRQLTNLVKQSSRYFPPGALAELAAAVGPSFAHVHSHAMFNAQAMLCLFIPPTASTADLPAGTAEFWIKVWGTVDRCTSWDATWAVIFSRLASADSIVDATYGPDGAPTTSMPGAFPWGLHQPFFASRMLEILNVPVAGGQPVVTQYPYEATAILGGEPAGVAPMCRLMVRTLTVALPKGASALRGDVASGPGDASTLGGLERLLRAISSFFYPTSSAASRMNTLLRSLTMAFSHRVGREAGVAAAGALLAAGSLPPPPSSPETRAGGTPPISAALIRRYVDTVLPLSLMGLYSSSTRASNAVWETGTTLKALAQLAPARVTRELVAMTSMALDPGSVDAAHQAPNALYALSILTPALLFPVPHLAPALPELLHASLPGIDPNDSAKTQATISFFSAVCTAVPLVDAEDAASTGEDAPLSLPPWHPTSPAFTGVPIGGYIPAALSTVLKPMAGMAGQKGLDAVPGAGRSTASGCADIGPDGARITVSPFPEEGEAHGLTPDAATAELFTAARSSMPRLTEWVLLVLDRTFLVLAAKEGSGGGKEKKKKADALGSNLHTLFSALFPQLSPRLAKAALDRVVSWLSGVGVIEAVKDVARLEEALVASSPVAGLAKLVPLHTSAIATAAGNDDKLVAWHARLLSGAVKSSGAAVLPHLPAITAALRTCLGSKDSDVRDAGGKLLRWSLACLLSTYDAESRSHAPSAWANLGMTWQSWAMPYAWTAPGNTQAKALEAAGLALPGLEPAWHSPSTPERTAALALVQEFIVGPMDRLSAFATTYGPPEGAAPPPYGEAAMPATESEALTAAGSTAAGVLARTTLAPAVLSAESERLRTDLSSLLMGFRGAVCALSDFAGPRGDDIVISTGTAGQALTFEAGRASYADGSGAERQPLRHAIAMTLDAVLKAINAHPDFNRDVKSLTAAIHLAFRTICGRGSKMFKATQAKRDLSTYKRFYREPLMETRATFFSRLMWAAAAAQGAAPPASSTQALFSEGGTHGTSRGYMIARISYLIQRRQAEGLFAIPKALHGGVGEGGEAYLGAAGDGDAAFEDEEEGSSDPTSSPLDTADMEAEMRAPEALGSSGSGTTASPLAVGMDLRGAVPVFGRRTLSKLKTAEQPYAALLASVLRLGLHPYDEVRREAGGHSFTMIGIHPWLRKGAQVSALMRLDRLASTVVAAGAAARAGPLYAAADALFRGEGVRGGTPPGLLASLQASLEAGAIASPIPSPSEAAAAATVPLSHSTVFGLSAIAFLNAGSLAADWDSLDRAIRVLLRSSALIRGLPGDKHTDALGMFGMLVVRLLEKWHVLPIPQGHPQAEHWAGVREKLLRHLLVTIAPQAFASAGDIGRSPAFGSSALPISSPSAPRLVLRADGSKAPSAAPLSDSPLHWRYELVAGGFLSVLMAPAPCSAAALAIDAAQPGVARPPAPDRALLDRAVAPENMWLWALSNVLSDNVLLRMQSVDFLIQLLHSHAAARAARICPGPGSFPRVHALLTDPAYVSQFVAAVAQDHADKGEGGTPTPGALESMLAQPGMQELATPMECTRVFIEYSRYSLQGGALSSIAHMVLFELLGAALPDSIPVFLDALAALGEGGAKGGKEGGTAAAGSDVDMQGGETAPPKAKADVNDPATLRARQATVAEAFAGFMRAVSSLKAPGSHPIADAAREEGASGPSPPLGTVVYSLADANFVALAASAGASGLSFPPPTPLTSADLDARQAQLLSLVVPIWDTVGLDWTADWSNALRFLARQRHPSQLPILTRFVFASAAVAVGAAGTAAEYPADFDRTGQGELLAVVGGGARAPRGSPSAAPTAAAPSSTSTFAGQVRALSFVQALVFEFFPTSEGSGPAGSVPGITAAEEAAGEFGVHAATEAVVGSVPMATMEGVVEASPHSIVPARRATIALCRQLLPTLLSALPHSYKACREEVSRTIMIMTECAWSMSDAGIHAPAELLRFVTPPADCDWHAWAPAVVATVVHLASAARANGMANVADAGASGQPPQPSGGVSDTPAERERSKWGSRALEGCLYLVNDGLGADTNVLTPIILPLIPVLLTAVTHPDRDLSKLAGVVGGTVAHTLSLARPGTAGAPAADADARFFGAVEALLAGVLPPAAKKTAAPLAGVRSAGDILAALFDAFGTAIEGKAEGEGEEAAAKTTVAASKPPPAALSSPIVLAVPPLPPKAVGAGGAGGTQWFVRRAVLSALTPIRARNLLWLPKATDASFLALVESRLDDKQVEVADEAGDTLIGFVMTMPPAERSALAMRLLALADTKLPRKVASPEPGAPVAEAEAFAKYRTRQARQLRKRLAGVLGMSAVVRASPFDVPSYLPQILADLAAHASDPNPVGPAVKGCIAEFRRTHADNWEAHRAVFTEEQLADVLNVTSSSTYFA